MKKDAIAGGVVAVLLCALSALACTRDAPTPLPEESLALQRTGLVQSKVEVSSVKQLPSYQVFTPPTIDGDLGDWSAAGTASLTASNASFMAGTVTDDADLSAEFRSRWDAQYL